jgi:hypothetical protein
MRLHPDIIAGSSIPFLYVKAYAGLFQDSAGTTAASANNAPVGKWQNQNGDNHNLTQDTSGSRPFLQTALPSLLFDGTDDYLSYSGRVTDAAGSLVVVFKTGATAFATRGAQVLFSSADAGTANNWLEVGITSEGKIYIESNAGGTKHTMVGSTFLSVSTSYFLFAAFDDTDYYVSVNGVEQNPLTIENVGTFAWLGDVSGADNLVLGGTVTSAGLVRPFQGEILEAALYSYDITS